MRCPRSLPRIGAAVVAIMAASTSATATGQSATSPAPSTSVPVVRLPFPKDDGSLTPYTFELGYPLLTLVYDTLLWRDADGVPQPSLARSVLPSPDGTRLEVHLAEGARWHDGPPVTSQDVAFTFDYVAKRPHPRFTPELAAVVRVETPDPSTAVIVLRHASPGFSDQPLADLPIMPAHLWKALRRDQAAPDGLPVGSGPYRLVEHRPGLSYRLQANDGYFLGSPAVQTIEVPFMSSAEETLQALERRTVDAIPLSLSRSLAERLGTQGISLKKGPSYLGTVLLFNLRAPPFDRLENRQAVAAGLDIDRISGLIGDSVPAERGYLHPNSPWAPPAPLTRPSTVGTTASVLAGGPPLEVLAPDSDPVQSEAARQIALSLIRVGVAASAKLVPSTAMSKALGEDGSTPGFTLAISSSPALSSYDPDYLRQAFGSMAPLNYGGYSSLQFDQLADRIAATPDTTARRALVGDALRLLATDTPVVPLFFSNAAFAYRPAIFDGWILVKGGGILDKRSFVGPRPAPPVLVPEPEERASPTPFGRSPLVLAALGLIGVAALLAMFLLVARLTRRR